MLSYQRDIDADFLAIYGIDLEATDISGPRYFALAHRLTAYAGVMAARKQEDDDEDQPVAASQAAAEQAAPARPGGTGEREVSLTAMRMQFPGLVSMAQG